MAGFLIGQSTYIILRMPEDFFKEIGRALSEKGHALLECFTCRDSEVPAILRNDHPDVGRSCASYTVLHEMIKSAGLQVESEHLRTAGRKYEGHSSEVATLVLRRF